MSMELNPKLLIGIGSQGMYILENVQRYYYESFKINKPEEVEYLYLETNKDNKVGVTPLENEIRQIYLDLDKLGAKVKELKKTGNRGWLPPEDYTVQAGMGAGGIRSIGRLALWGGDNFSSVLKSFSNIKQKLGQISQAKPKVFIAGSLTGGTGSSIFIDLAYMIRHIFPEIKELFGLFLLPPTPLTLTDNERKYANTYAALKDLRYFNMMDNKYIESWPNGLNKEFAIHPYELSQFISQDYSDGSAAISSLPGLCKIAGLYLFLQISGMAEKRYERLVDASGNLIIGKYGMFGLSAVEYPKDQIQEVLALNLSEDLLNRWINPQFYYSLNKNTQINNAEISLKVEEKFSSILDLAFDSLNNIEGADLIMEIQKEAEKINRNEIGIASDEYLRKLFSSSETDKLYQRIYYTLTNAVNTIIDGIYDEISNALNKTESLSYTKQVLNSFSNSIDRCIKYFQSLGISDSSQSWDNFIRNRVETMLKGLFKTVLEQDNVLKDRLLTTFEMMKMHIIYPKLIEIRENISSSALPLVSTQSKKTLPQTELFNKLITKITETIGRISTEPEPTHGDLLKFITIARRKSEVMADISDSSIPVKRIYQYNDFDTECVNAKETYKRTLGRSSVSKKDIIEEGNLFEFLKELLNKNIQYELYSICIKKYRKALAENNIIPDYDVAKFLINNHKMGIQYAKRSLSNLLSLNNNYISRHPEDLPRFIAGSDINKISSLIRAFQDEDFTDFADSNDGKLQLENLKNMVIFFSEDPLPNPLENISYAEEMKKLYLNKPVSIQDPDMTDERWRRDRTAYLTNESNN